MVAIPALEPIYHVGHVVPDARAAAERWARTAGVGPFFLFEDFEFVHPVYRGRDLGPRVTLAFGFSGEFCLELIEQQDAVDSIYREGPAGPHHVGIMVADVDARIAAYRAEGVEVVFRGGFAFGGECAYLDTRDTLGCLLELVSQHPVLEQMIGTMRAAHAGWDRRQVFAAL
ncbi:MAG TPA: VOC family protein [Steroidobacteraceae bacterium]|nr:VOC family protein [Steroidobacteraceae bacterium]